MNKTLLNIQTPFKAFLLFLLLPVMGVQASGAPVPIFYGLNESQSNSWAQVSANGTVGMVLFEHTTAQHATGRLVYKKILPNGYESSSEITTGTHLENAVLLFDAQDIPHIFVASSSNSNQVINHYSRAGNSQWHQETIINFYNEGGKFIYEMSAVISPDGSFHLLVLKTRSNPDSDDYYYAYLNANLYHVTNRSGNWQKELIKNYDMPFTLDEYSKMMNRQDIKVDKNGEVHIIFGKQINGSDWLNSAMRLRYVTNRTGNWVFETAADFVPNTRDDAGWYPSLALDTSNVPHISCCYISRVPTGSARSAKLLYIYRESRDTWISETVASSDDGYYGEDGRRYTGGLTHLVIDNQNTPHLIFSDIASSHAGMNYFNLGNIRYAVKEAGEWNIEKIYQQPLPAGNYEATEMYDMCLLMDRNGKIQVIGQEMQISSSTDYSCRLIRHVIEEGTQGMSDDPTLQQFELFQNYPNPFNPVTHISFVLPETIAVKLNIYNMSGQRIQTLLNERLPAGFYREIWDGTDENGQRVSSGVYFCTLASDRQYQTRRMIFLK